MNKKIKSSVGFMLSIFTLMGLFAVGTPTPLSAASCDSRTITGYVITNGNDTRARFTYGTDYYSVDAGNGTPTAVQTVPANQDQNIEAFLTGLSPSTQYFYRLEVTNQYGTAKVNIENFTTPACSTPTPPPLAQNTLPQGYLDGASCSYINGWSIDFNSTSSPVTVQVYKDGPAGSGSFITSALSNLPRADVNSNLNLSDNLGHAFNIPTPSAFKDTSSHTVYVYGVDVQTGAKFLLNNSPKTIPACQTPPPPVQTCQTPGAINIGGFLPCQFPQPVQPVQTCQTPGAINIGGFLPCQFPQPVQTCQTPGAINIGGFLPCQFPPSSTPQPTVNLTADDTNIDFNQSTILRWNSSNATSCTASGAWSGNKNLSGSESTGNLTSTRTFNITCSNNSGQQAFDSVTVNVDNDNNNNEEDPNVDIRADDLTVERGERTTVRWDSDNADSCRGSSGRNGWSGNRNLSGSFNTGDLTSDTTFRITCTNDSGSDDDSVTIRVEDRNQTCQDPSAINYRGTFPCNYSLQTCQDVSALNYRGVLPCRYNIVNNQQPTVVLYADSTNIAYNAATTIRWGTVNATSCFASGGSVGWAGTKSIGPGSFYTGSLTGSRTYTMTCSNSVGSATDSVTVNVRGRTITTSTSPRPAPTSLVLITSSVDRNQPIVPTLDNTRPRPGDEINYTVTYQNIGTGAITNLVLRIDLPYEVDYMFSNPNNPIRSGNTLIFNLGTLRANGQGTVTVRVRVRDNIPAGTNLNFPATLSYVDPSGFPQSVNANVSAQVWSEPVVVIQDADDRTVSLGANVFGAGFLPINLFGWLLLLILVLILVLLAKYLFNGDQPFSKRTTTTTIKQ